MSTPSLSGHAQITISAMMGCDSACGQWQHSAGDSNEADGAGDSNGRAGAETSAAFESRALSGAFESAA